MLKQKEYRIAQARWYRRQDGIKNRKKIDLA